MDLSNDIIGFVDTLGVVQGLLFGIMLVILYVKRNRSTLYLGIFIVLFALEPIPNILQSFTILEKYPQLDLLPVGFHFLAYPFLLVYIKKISILSEKKIDYWVFVPGVIEFIIAITIFFLPINLKNEIKETLFLDLYFISGLFYTLLIIVLILKQIHGNIEEVENQYSNMQNKTLKWSKWFAYFSIVFHVLILVNFFFRNHVWYAWISVFNVVLIYWISFKGISQKNIPSLVLNKDDSINIDIEEIVNESKISSKEKKFISESEARVIFDNVDSYVKKSKCFTNNGLTIIDIAEAVNIHPKRISFVINDITSQNFNNYINEYRVDLAKKMLRSNQTNNLSIEGIGIEAGFNSKATFYNAFKKNTKMTPSQYKRS